MVEWKNSSLFRQTNIRSYLILSGEKLFQLEPRFIVEENIIHFNDGEKCVCVCRCSVYWVVTASKYISLEQSCARGVINFLETTDTHCTLSPDIVCDNLVQCFLKRRTFHVNIVMESIKHGRRNGSCHLSVHLYSVTFSCQNQVEYWWIWKFLQAGTSAMWH